ncbi:MAG: AAA family ATPase [Cyanobacteria bacterium P01_A01_bin.3]
MSLTDCTHKLKTLMRSLHPVVAIETVEEERVQTLINGIANELNLPLMEWSITRGLARPPRELGMNGTEEPSKLLATLYKQSHEGIYLLKDFSKHLTGAFDIRLFREVAQKYAGGRSVLVLVDAELKIPAELESLVARWEMPLPDYHELRALLRSVVSRMRAQHKTEMNLQPNEIEELLRALNGMTLDCARRAITYATLVDGKLSRDDIRTIQQQKAEMVRARGMLEYYPPSDNLSELGGFQSLKRWLHRARVGFTKTAQRLNLSPPRGICIVGVQGCGKSLAVKAIAREWQQPLLKLDLGQVYDKYVGESEKNFHKAIAMAEVMAPAVLWIDEIEKAISTGNDELGTSKRMLGAFLTWLQEKSASVFVVATANDLSGLPPELLRKGRFDEIFFVDLPDRDERCQIFEIHLRKRKQEVGEFDLLALIEESEGFSGAEIEQAVTSSLYQSLYLNKPFTTEMICAEMTQTVPLSVSRQEDIAMLRAMAQERFVNVR